MIAMPAVAARILQNQYGGTWAYDPRGDQFLVLENGSYSGLGTERSHALAAGIAGATNYFATTNDLSAPTTNAYLERGTTESPDGSEEGQDWTKWAGLGLLAFFALRRKK